MSTVHEKILDDLIITALKENASDLHLAEGRPPILRVSSFLVPLVKMPTLSKENILEILSSLLSEADKKEFDTYREANFSYSHKLSSTSATAEVSHVRFRCNAFNALGKTSIAMRLIPTEIRTFKELNLPPILESFAKRQQGFFIVVGPVGVGKSTTLAAMIEAINLERLEHIITIEDPIEYIFKSKKSVIDQREVQSDTVDFHTALNGVFRQDADILMIGEMRDPETISTAVTAAETGHLVLSTLHTNTAAQTVDRIIDSFIAAQQAQIRLQLSSSLLGIFSQRLIPRISGGLIPAFELLINNNAIANLIRDKRTQEISSVIETSSKEGMISLNRSLADLVRGGEITVENAFQFSNNPRTLERLV